MMMHLACQWVSELVRELVGEFVLSPLTRGTVIMELNWNVNLETYNMRTFSHNVCFWSCTATCAREKKIERVCASVRLRVRGQSKCSLRLANVPRLARLVTSRANKSHLITTGC